MPGFDKSGPMGAGPMTGGGRGRCNPATTGNFAPHAGDYHRGFGLRRGFRGGFGRRLAPERGYGRWHGFYPTTTGAQTPMEATAEIEMLKTEADQLRNSLEEIDKRIQSLGMRPTEEA